MVSHHVSFSESKSQLEQISLKWDADHGKVVPWADYTRGIELFMTKILVCSRPFCLHSKSHDLQPLVEIGNKIFRILNP